MEVGHRVGEQAFIAHRRTLVYRAGRVDPGLFFDGHEWLVLVRGFGLCCESKWPVRMDPMIFIFAGSKGQSLKEFENEIRSRNKGQDFLSRIPKEYKVEMPAITLQDRVVVFSHISRKIQSRTARLIRAIERLALYCIATKPLKSFGELDALARKTVAHIPIEENRVL